MAHRPVALAEAGSRCKRGTHEAAAPRDRFLQIETHPEARRDGTRQGAAGAVVVAGLDTPALPARDLAFAGHQPVDEHVALLMPALHQHGWAAFQH